MSLEWVIRIFKVFFIFHIICYSLKINWNFSTMLRGIDSSYFWINVTFLCCQNRSLQTKWLKKLNFSWFWRPTVWNQGVGSIVLPLEALGGNLFLWLSASGDWTSALQSLLPPLLPPISLCLSLRRVLVIGFRAHLDNPGWSLHLKILNLIVTAKSLFPNKKTFAGSRA